MPRAPRPRRWPPSAAPAALLAAGIAALLGPLAAAQSGGAPQAPSSQSRPAAPGPWSSEPWPRVLERAAREARPVLLEFSASWCEPCRALERQSFPDAAVAAELARFVCKRVDVESEEGRALAEHYRARTLPRLVFLDPDGAAREALVGYLDAPALAAELARIARDEGTIGEQRRALARAPGERALHLALARRLRSFGDEAGCEAQRRALLELDPSGRSLEYRQLLMDRALEPLQRSLDTAELCAFLAGETHPALLYEGWRTVAAAERAWVKRLDDEHDARGLAEHRLRLYAAERAAWPHTPPERVAYQGGELAWELYEQRAELPRELLDFALSVADAAVRASQASAAGLDPNLLDTQACLLFAIGRKDEALAAVRRCIELAPGEAVYRKRLGEFGG